MHEEKLEQREHMPTSVSWRLSDEVARLPR